MNATEFKNLIYKIAGSKYHRIEVDDEVFNNHILPLALHYWVENHYDGSQKFVYELKLVPGQFTYQLPPKISAVVAIMQSNVDIPVPFRTLAFNRNPDMFLAYDMVSYSMFNAWMEEAQITFGWYYDFQFSKDTKLFTIMNPERQTTLYLVCYTDESVEHMDKIRENPIFQKLVTGYLLLNWARSLTKYDSELVGGRKFDKDAIRQDAEKTIEEARKEIEEELSEEPPILIG